MTTCICELYHNFIAVGISRHTTHFILFFFLTYFRLVLRLHASLTSQCLSFLFDRSIWLFDKVFAVFNRCEYQSRLTLVSGRDHKLLIEEDIGFLGWEHLRFDVINELHWLIIILVPAFTFITKTFFGYATFTKAGPNITVIMAFMGWVTLMDYNCIESVWMILLF